MLLANKLQDALGITLKVNPNDESNTGFIYNRKVPNNYPYKRIEALPAKYVPASALFNYMRMNSKSDPDACVTMNYADLRHNSLNFDRGSDDPVAIIYRGNAAEVIGSEIEAKLEDKKVAKMRREGISEPSISKSSILGTFSNPSEHTFKRLSEKVINTTVVHSVTKPFSVYIGDGTKWRNPFKKGVDGESHKETTALYRRWLLNGSGRYLLSYLNELKDQILGCPCRSPHCHGIVLAHLANNTHWHSPYSKWTESEPKDNLKTKAKPALVKNTNTAFRIVI